MTFDEFEIRKAQRARFYMEKLSQGISPIDDSIISDDSVLNNDKIRACFSYMIGVMETYEEALEGVSTPSKRHIYQKKKSFDLTAEERRKIYVTKDKLKVGEFVKNINTLIDENTMNPLKSSSVNKWLLRKGFLEIVVGKDGKNHKWPTVAGIEVGITKERFLSKTNFPYYAVLYGAKAQQFIADNIGEIIDINNEKSKKRYKVSSKVPIPDMPELNRH